MVVMQIYDLFMHTLENRFGLSFRMMPFAVQSAVSVEPLYNVGLESLWIHK